MNLMKIESDYNRFKQIVRGKIRKELRRFVSQGEMIGKQGKDLISIPVPQIDIPQIVYGSKQQGGVGQGQGKIGDVLGAGEGEEHGAGQAGNAPGEHLLEVEIGLQELAEILGEELALPRIQPKGEEELLAKRHRYASIRSAGPESLRHFKRTYKQALKRTLISGIYNPTNPVVIPIREDLRYRSWKDQTLPKNNAVIFYMMDVSGSMGSEQKEIVRIETFWIDTWLRSQYDGLKVHYIVHDALAREVDQETFYRTRESGGTIISSAYKLCLEIIEKKYNPLEWNIYPFHFSDGDNWSGSDTQDCLELLQKQFFPRVNVFCYGQVESQYGSGQFLQDLRARFGEEEQLITSRIASKEKIVDSIKDFLGKGK